MTWHVLLMLLLKTWQTLLLVVLLVAVVLFIRNRRADEQLESDFAFEAPDEAARIAEDLAKTRELLEPDEG